jgi:hypothetical protein
MEIKVLDNDIEIQVLDNDMKKPGPGFPCR